MKRLACIGIMAAALSGCVTLPATDSVEATCFREGPDFHPAQRHACGSAAGPCLDATAGEPTPAAAERPVQIDAADDTAPAAMPAVRLVNSKRILLNYEIKDIGISGVSDVELWYTQDSRTWQKYPAPPQNRAPFVVEVDEEGLYGFTMVARSGVGQGKRPPQTGDLPQVLVEVDLTKPTVQLVGVKPVLSAEGRSLTVLWAANDKNLGSHPISLSYAKTPRGPWLPIAANLENTGMYRWRASSALPASFFVRVECTDSVGNVGAVQTQSPVLLDLSQPSVSILAVESAVE